MGGGTGSLIPMTTSSGQVQFTHNLSNSSFNMGNQMDLIFNRKVMKPIRGGGATGMAMGRERTESRQGFGN